MAVLLIAHRLEGFSDRRHRVAVIGAGMAGRARAHGYRSAGTVFSAGLPPVRLASVADINEELAGDTARRYGFARSDSSWQAIVKAADIDVVSVVVANHLHREIVEELAAAGKHVLCEKPLAPTSTDAQAMIDAVDAAGVVARVGFTFRRTPGIAAARELIASGELGRPLVNARYWTDWQRPAGADELALPGPRVGGAGGLGSHLADTAEFLLRAGRGSDRRGATTVIGERETAGARGPARPHQVGDERVEATTGRASRSVPRRRDRRPWVSRIAFDHPTR
jgi:predicted dehydrogenase